ncbi:transmembrane protein 60-like [Tropilaelaps mercedesae]|uniref:Transmembrane protein 60-like n=1 Tax=Tropilaelaps mercedesae TaxID=418985 RepID=A0A1V9X7M4_9ACAR|nr:transmembrane protein 60-like [Tropilaelaps mercedesae]
MSTLQMTLSLWFLCAVFILMLALRLDDRTHWSCFSVFTPMWLLDAKLLAISGYKVYSRLGRQHFDPTCLRKLLFLLGVVVKASFQALLCLRLEYLPHMPWSVVFIPLWAALIFFQANIIVRIYYFLDPA